MKDILCRLTESREWLSRDGFITSARNASDAADEIKQLRAENARQAERIAELEAQLVIEKGQLDLRDEENRILFAKSEAQSAVIEMAKTAIDEVQSLIEESRGVYGLHLNGDESPWSELEQGGRFERLGALPDAIAAINALPDAIAAINALPSRVADLLHLLEFAEITTPSTGDGEQAQKAMADIRAMLESAPQPPAIDRDAVISLLSDDALATSFQTLGQYRAHLIGVLKAKAPDHT